MRLFESRQLVGHWGTICSKVATAHLLSWVLLYAGVSVAKRFLRSQITKVEICIHRDCKRSLTALEREIPMQHAWFWCLPTLVPAGRGGGAKLKAVFDKLADGTDIEVTRLCQHAHPGRRKSHASLDCRLGSMTALTSARSARTSGGSAQGIREPVFSRLQDTSGTERPVWTCLEWSQGRRESCGDFGRGLAPRAASKIEHSAAGDPHSDSRERSRPGSEE